MAREWSAFLWIFHNMLITCLRKAIRGRDSWPLSLLIWYNNPVPWITKSTIQTNGNCHHFFIQISLLGYVLVHSIDKTHDAVVAVEMIWLLYLNIYFFFNFVTAPNTFLRFTRFKVQLCQVSSVPSFPDISEQSRKSPFWITLM